MNSQSKPKRKVFMQALIQETAIIQDGTLALKQSILVIHNDFYKQRKLKILNFRREPIMTKTKIKAEALLMQSMTETGKPYKNPEHLSNDIHDRVR
jgi:hypothetical protein